MSKYEPLWNRLKAEGSPIVNLSKEAVQFGYQVDKISMKGKHITFLQIREKF
jgi:hypothetical protein